MPRPVRPIVSAMALLATLAACGPQGAPGVVGRSPGAGPKPGPGAPKASQAPVTATGVTPADVAKVAPLATLTGKVKLDFGGAVISDHGATAISNNGGSLIANNGSGVIANNGSGVIANNGSGVIANNGSGVIAPGGSRALTRYALKASPEAPRPAGVGSPAPSSVELALADAAVEVLDAAGQPVLGADGKPLVAMTDKTGTYAFTGTLPAGNMVLRVKLAAELPGAAASGQLSALLPRREGARREAAIDTATTLGATYVLSQYVKGSQATFDKLPASEADRLVAGLAAAKALITEAPAYRPEALVALTETLRAQAKAVDESLESIRALLLGQARLGAGKPATAVPLFEITALAVDGQGRLLFAEHTQGRVRAVTTDGRIETEVDRAYGRVKANYPTCSALLAEPDGALLLAAWGKPDVYRIAPDGTTTSVVGNGKRARGALDVPATATSVIPQSLLRTRDGTLYVGEGAAPSGTKGDDAIPRVIAVGKDGLARRVPTGADWGSGRVTGLAEASDGALWVLYYAFKDDRGYLYRYTAATGAQLVASALLTNNRSALTAGADGEVILGVREPGRIVAYAPDGKSRVLAGAGGAAGTQGLYWPTGVLRQPDGTLYVGDEGANQIFRLTPDGRYELVAGAVAGTQDASAGLFLNSPGGVDYDPQGRMLVSEAGSHTIKRLDGNQLVTVAGSVPGFAGDGGPASAALLDTPLAIVQRGAELFFIDGGNWRLRKIGADGVITTLAGNRNEDTMTVMLKPGESKPSQDVPLRAAFALALDDAGAAYVSSALTHQIVRVKDGEVTLVAGAIQVLASAMSLADTLKVPAASGAPAEMALGSPTGLAFDPTAAQPTLYIADSLHFRILRVTDPGGPAAHAETVAGIPVAAALAQSAEQLLGAAPGPAKDAALIQPAGMCFDAAGNMYVGELGTRNIDIQSAVMGSEVSVPADLPSIPPRVRKIAKDGTITTIAGPGGKFFTDPDAEDALGLPTGLAIDPQGRLVIVDTGHNQIKLLPAGTY